MQYSKLYILLPTVCSGGPELAHQLIDYLQCKSKDAYAVYFDGNGIIKDASVPSPYQKYNIKIATNIIDSAENILVLPEMLFDYARLYKNIRIYCWWMSVDNFIKNDLHRQPIRWNQNKNIFQNFRKIAHVALWHLPFPRFNILCFFRMNANRVTHLYQSEYAHRYILANKLSNCYPLSDYINPDFFPSKPIEISQKEDIILYNPAKGLPFTIKLMQLLPEYPFIALQNMNREALSAAYTKAKLYIDFGNFPGKDRIPREAALHDCCVITGKQGAAAFYEDFPIPEQYKFDTNKTGLDIIADAIRKVMTNYESKIMDFAYYKKIIGQERAQFYKEIDTLFIE